MLSTRALLVVVILLAIPAAAFATEHFVSIVDFAFSPQNVTVVEGDIVTWTNNGNFLHTSTSDDGGVTWDSGDLNNGESFSFTFTSAGTNPYHCTYHPVNMVGTITVDPGENVPTLSEWGMMLLALMLVLGGTIGVIRRRKVAVA